MKFSFFTLLLAISLSLSLSHLSFSIIFNVYFVCTVHMFVIDFLCLNNVAIRICCCCCCCFVTCYFLCLIFLSLNLKSRKYTFCRKITKVNSFISLGFVLIFLYSGGGIGIGGMYFKVLLLSFQKFKKKSTFHVSSFVCVVYLLRVILNIPYHFYSKWQTKTCDLNLILIHIY